MSNHIHHWSDGYLAIRQRAETSRGVVEIDLGGGATSRWPRTTNGDVLAITALIDPAVSRHGPAGITRRWLALLDDVAEDALFAAGERYAQSRSFWATVEAVCVYLDDVEVPAPAPELWDALIEQLGSVAIVGTRNVGPTEDGPIAHFDGIKTYSDLYLAQLAYLSSKRGTDRMEAPAGMGFGNMAIPRSTNSDVLQLATYWSNALANVTHVMGHDGAVKRWTPMLNDVDAIAKSGAPDAVYPKNNEVWRGLAAVSTQVAISDEAPTKWDLVVSSVKDAVTELPKTIAHAATKAGELVAGTATAVGELASDVGKGLFSGVSTPLLIGAGILGVVLISRGRRTTAEA